MIKAVLDTNILVSGLIEGRGASAAIVDAWRNWEIIVLTTQKQMEEVGEVLRRPHIRKHHGMSNEDIEEFLEEFREFSVEVDVGEIRKVIEEDPDDDFLLALAAAGSADYIVSGDRHILALKQYWGIRCVSPGDCLRVLREERQPQ